MLAQDEAKLLNHSYIGMEHLLFDLIYEGEGAAAGALEQMRIPLQTAREQVAGITGQGQQVPSGHIPFSPHAKCILELSLREALQMDHSHIGTEHILFRLAREGKGVAAQTLSKLGANFDRVHSTVIQLLAGYQGKEASIAGTPKAEPEKFSPQVSDQFGRSLIQAAREDRLDPVTDYVGEIEHVMMVLSRRVKNNPMLIDEPGVGKTTAVESFSQAIVRGNMPGTLRDKQIYILDLGALVASLRYRGDFGECLKKMPRGIKTRGGIMLFIGEIHTLVGASAVERVVDAASILEPVLARGEFQIIDAITLDEHRKHIEKDVALECRFQPIQVAESFIALIIDILKGLRDHYKTYYRITITDEVLMTAVTMADRYIQGRFLPDKAIDLIDEADARLRIRRTTAPSDLREFDEQIVRLEVEEDAAINTQDFETVTRLRNDITRVQVQYAEKEGAWKQSDPGIPAMMDEEEVMIALFGNTGIPVPKLTEEESVCLLRMEQELGKHYIGREDAIKVLAHPTRHTRANLKDPKRPPGPFTFARSSGAGKTELTKALIEFLLGDEDALIALDISEYSKKHTASRMFGSPPGYADYEEGGQLTEKVCRKSSSVVLSDEIEKVHPDIFNPPLQILDEGRLVDVQSHVVDFRNTVIVMTTNLGSRDISKGVSPGSSRARDEAFNYEKMRAKVSNELRQHFRPEFLNRIDEIVVFHQLMQSDTERIVGLMAAQIESHLVDRDTDIELASATKTLAAKRGFDPMFGTHPLHRTLQRDIGDMLVEKILFGGLVAGQIIQVGVIEEGAGPPFRFTGISKTPPALPTETSPVE